MAIERRCEGDLTGHHFWPSCQRGSCTIIHYGAFGIGIDLSEPNIEWAEKYSLGNKFCAGDGRRLEWLPKNTVDYVYTVSSIYHLTTLDHCDTLLTMLEKLKMNGAIYSSHVVMSPSNVPHVRYGLVDYEKSTSNHGMCRQNAH